MNSAVRGWLYLFRVPLALLGVFAFFALYNRFVLDENLQNLRASFEIMDSASEVGQAEAALLLVNQTLTAQMAQPELDLRAAVTLQYSQEALSSSRTERPVDDAQVLVGILQEEKSAARPPVLMTMDGIVSSVQKMIRKASLIPKHTLAKPLAPMVDLVQLEEAARLERQGQIAEAVAIYRRVLELYPEYTGRSTLKLRIGSLLQKIPDFPEAEKAFREALQDARSLEEQALARKMLRQLMSAWGGLEKKLLQEQKVQQLPMGAARQKAAYELGSSVIRGSDFARAAGLFEESFRADPGGELALPALFKQAWCLRMAGQTEEAFAQFSEIIRLAPNSDWHTAAMLQIAEMYKVSGNFEAAVEMYEKATGLEPDDAALTSIAYALAGCTYEFDLHEPGKARIYFKDVGKKFPASPYSTVGRRLEKLRIKKGRAEAGVTSMARPGGRLPAPVRKQEVSDMFAMGSPLLNWLENFLPLFVSVFNDRLAKYMEAVGETAVARRFTEDEFNELVVRELQRRFPGQVSGIQTKIHSDGFTGSGNVHLGMLKFSVEAKIGIVVEEFKPNALLHYIRVGKIELPTPLLKFLQERVNRSIDRKRYPLKVKEYRLNEGYAWISVELAE